MRSTGELPKSWAISASMGSCPPRACVALRNRCTPRTATAASTSSTLGSTEVPSPRAAHSPHPSDSGVTTRTKSRVRVRCTPAAVPMSTRNGTLTRTSSMPVSFTGGSSRSMPLRRRICLIPSR